MFNKVCRWGLWISTIIILLLSAVQALSGNWITYFLFLPGASSFGNAFLRAMVSLASYHRFAGFAIGGLSVLVLFFAFFSKSSIWVRIFAVVGFIMMALAAAGGVLYVTSGHGDQMALGQMSDAFVGVFGAYFIQLFFMNGTPSLPWRHRIKEN